VLLQGREPLRECRTGRKLQGAATGGVLLPGRCCYRGNFAGRKPSCYYRGNATGGSHRGSTATGQVLPPEERCRAEAIGGYRGSAATGGTSYGAYATGGMLPPEERRRTEAINVLLPGDRRRAKTKGILPLGDVVRGVRYRGSAATGGTSQGGSHKRVITGGSPQGGSRGNAVTEEYYMGRTLQGECCHRGNVAGRKP